MKYSLLKVSLLIIFSFLLFAPPCTPQGKGYNVEEDAKKLFNMDLKSVVKKFRRSPEYLKILRNQVNEMFKEIEIRETFLFLSQAKDIKRRAREVIHQNGTTTCATTTAATNVTTTAAGAAKPVFRAEKTTQARGVAVLDEYPPLSDKLMVETRNKLREVGFEEAGNLIHNIIKSIEDDSPGGNSTAGGNSTTPGTTTKAPEDLEPTPEEQVLREVTHHSHTITTTTHRPLFAFALETTLEDPENATESVTVKDQRSGKHQKTKKTPSTKNKKVTKKTTKMQKTTTKKTTNLKTTKTTTPKTTKLKTTKLTTRKTTKITKTNKKTQKSIKKPNLRKSRSTTRKTTKLKTTKPTTRKTIKTTKTITKKTQKPVMEPILRRIYTSPEEIKSTKDPYEQFLEFAEGE